MDLTLTDAFLLFIATWRLAHLLTKEAGPFRVFSRVRSLLVLGSNTSFWGKLAAELASLFSCVYCTSVWVGAGLVVLHILVTPWATWVLAASGGALMLRAWSGVLHDSYASVPQEDFDTIVEALRD